MKTVGARHTWIIRYLLLWTTGTRTPRVEARESLGLPMAYALHGYEVSTLTHDLAALHQAGLLNRHKGRSRGLVYWLADPKAAKAWAATQPEPELPGMIEYVTQQDETV